GGRPLEDLLRRGARAPAGAGQGARAAGGAAERPAAGGYDGRVVARRARHGRAGRRARRGRGGRGGGGGVPHGPHVGGAALAVAPAERIHAAVRETHVPRVPRVGDAGRRRPVVARGGAAARRRGAARCAVGVEGRGRGHRRVDVLVVHDALQLPHVRQPP